MKVTKEDERSKMHETNHTRRSLLEACVPALKQVGAAKINVYNHIAVEKWRRGNVNDKRNELNTTEPSALESLFTKSGGPRTRNIRSSPPVTVYEGVV
jgi:hypothetical protein